MGGLASHRRAAGNLPAHAPLRASPRGAPPRRPARTRSHTRTGRGAAESHALQAQPWRAPRLWGALAGAGGRSRGAPAWFPGPSAARALCPPGLPAPPGPPRPARLPCLAVPVGSSPPPRPCQLSLTRTPPARPRRLRAPPAAAPPPPALAREGGPGRGLLRRVTGSPIAPGGAAQSAPGVRALRAAGRFFPRPPL